VRTITPTSAYVCRKPSSGETAIAAQIWAEKAKAIAAIDLGEGRSLIDVYVYPQYGQGHSWFVAHDQAFTLTSVNDWGGRAGGEFFADYEAAGQALTDCTRAAMSSLGS